MKRKHLDFEQYKKKVFLENPQLKAEYNKLQPEFALVETILRAQMKRKLWASASRST